jgi:hypothetical protein
MPFAPFLLRDKETFMSDSPHDDPDPHPGVARTERMLPPQPVGATTLVPVLAVVALLIAICLYFFGGFST